jgi:hypothetical protein
VRFHLSPIPREAGQKKIDVRGFPIAPFAAAGWCLMPLRTRGYNTFTHPAFAI